MRSRASCFFPGPWGPRLEKRGGNDVTPARRGADLVARTTADPHPPKGPFVPAACASASADSSEGDAVCARSLVDASVCHPGGPPRPASSEAPRALAPVLRAAQVRRLTLARRSRLRARPPARLRLRRTPPRARASILGCATSLPRPAPLGLQRNPPAPPHESRIPPTPPDASAPTPLPPHPRAPLQRSSRARKRPPRARSAASRPPPRPPRVLARSARSSLLPPTSARLVT